jgi:Zn-dependent protease with chaperone function
MDFFKHQDQAKSRSGGIYILFFLFVGILGAINGLLIYYGAAWLGIDMPDESLLELSCWAAGVTYLVMFGGAMIESIQFSSGGGERVAEMLGGQLLQPTTRNPDERKLLNIVEEMAIASGTPVPKVYILEEEGVNAFAAGTQPSNSVIGVTRGALNTFNRDEMQGVIAHEFSHILNGDVRRNIRLAALVFGIFCLYILGSMLIRMGVYSGAGSRRNNKDGAGAALAVMAVGLVMCAIGLLGQLLGRILQMAHSRQREFLADASAVQFTRNPTGIANALKKLGGGQSRLHSPRSSSMSHMFFGEVSLSGLLSSHPPLAERIKRIQSDWDGQFTTTSPVVNPTSDEYEQSASSAVAAGVAGFAGGTTARKVQNASASNAPTAGFNHSQDKSMQQIAAELLTARLAIDALLLAPERETQQRQLDALANRLDTFEFREFQRVCKSVLSLPEENRFPLLEMVLPTLEQISEPQFQQLVTEMDEMIAADGRISKWEFLLRYAVLHHFKRNCGYISHREVKSKQAMSVPQAGGIILRMLVQLSHSDEKSAWQQAVSSLNGVTSVIYPEGSFPPHWTVLHQAFQTIEKAPHAVKQALMQAGVSTALMDGQVTPEEMDVLRLMGMVMDVPVPVISQRR